MASQPNRKRAYSPPQIPDRLYFKIGDVARLCGVETYVLRFWESQFPQLKPNKSGTGQRLYRRRDVEMALEIKRLVHAEGYTLAGARTVLDQEQRRPGIAIRKTVPPAVTTNASMPLLRLSVMRALSCARSPTSSLHRLNSRLAGAAVWPLSAPPRARCFRRNHCSTGAVFDSSAQTSTCRYSAAASSWAGSSAAASGASAASSSSTSAATFTVTCAVTSRCSLMATLMSPTVLIGSPS